MTDVADTPATETKTSQPLMAVQNLKVLFPIKSGVIIDRVVGRVHAVDDVSFDLDEGETLGVVGESGCGKTTLIRVLVRLIAATSGTIEFRGQDITKSKRREMEPIRREMQMVFQDPQASLNPRKRVGQILATPLKMRGVGRDQLTAESQSSCSTASASAASTSTASRTSSRAASASGSGSPARSPSIRG